MGHSSYKLCKHLERFPNAVATGAETNQILALDKGASWDAP